MDFVYDEHFELTILSQQMLAASELTTLRNLNETEKEFLVKTFSFESGGLVKSFFTAVSKVITYIAKTIIGGIKGFFKLINKLFGGISSLMDKLTTKGDNPKETKVSLSKQVDDAIKESFASVASMNATIQKAASSSFKELDNAVSTFIRDFKKSVDDPKRLQELINSLSGKLEKDLSESGFKSRTKTSKGETITTYYYGTDKSAHKLTVRKKNDSYIGISVVKGPKVAEITEAPNKANLKSYMNDLKAMEAKLGTLKVTDVEEEVSGIIKRAALIDDLPKETTDLLATLVNTLGIVRRYQHINLELLMTSISESGKVGKACIENLEDA